MGASFLGLIAGVVLAIADFAILTFAGRSIHLAESRGILRMTAIVQLIAFPIIGWFLGPYIFGD